MSVNTKNFIKAIRPAVVAAGIAADVKRVLTREFGLTFQTPVWDDSRHAYRKVFKLAPRYPQSLSTDGLRRAAAEIPSRYPAVREAVNNALGDEDRPSAATSTGDVPVADLVALLREHGERNDWCSSAELTMEDHLGLHFSEDENDDRYVLTGDNPTTVTRQALAEYIRCVDRDYGDTGGVQSFLDELRRRWWTSGATAQQAQTRNGLYTVSAVANMSRSQLTAIGWDGNRADFNFSYNGVNGRATVQSAR